MATLNSLKDFKRQVQLWFDDNERAMEAFGRYYWAQLKAYLIEVNPKLLSEVPCPAGKWHPLDVPGWYVNIDAPDIKLNESFVLNKIGDRVWAIFSLADAKLSDLLVQKLIDENRGIDCCWLTRGLMASWSENENWIKKGVGVRFEDGLRPEETRSYLSMKAWHGADILDERIRNLLSEMEETFAVNSVRWQKLSGGDVVISSEWYSNGKVTINKAVDVEEAMQCIIDMACRYEYELNSATKIRNSTLAAFEIEFSRSIDVDSFSRAVSKGFGEVKLWLVELEKEGDYSRYSGVDLHTWDRVLLGMAPRYAHLVIPRDGCVNAAPRIATVHGEECAGKTSILIDGVDVFAGPK